MLVIVGRNTWPAVLARGNLHLALQPLVAGATFIVYCPLMLLGFAINRCTPPIVVRIDPPLTPSPFNDLIFADAGDGGAGVGALPV